VILRESGMSVHVDNAAGADSLTLLG